MAHIQLGLVAVIIGWAIGFGVVIGSGNHRGGLLVLISLALTLLTMVYSEFLIVMHFVVKESGASIPLLIDPTAMLFIVGASIKADPLTLLFWAIALYGAYKLPSGAADDD